MRTRKHQKDKITITREMVEQATADFLKTGGKIEVGESQESDATFSNYSSDYEDFLKGRTGERLYS